MAEIAVTAAIATLILVVGFLVGWGPVGKVPFLIREAGAQTFIHSILRCISTIYFYTKLILKVRSRYTPTQNLSALLPSGLAIATLTFAIRMYYVLTYSTYTRLWIFVTVGGFICFAFVICVTCDIDLNLFVVVATPALFAGGFIVGSGPVGEVPVVIREAVCHAFICCFLCSVATLYIPARNYRSLFIIVLGMATLTLVIGMYNVLTHSAYTRLWIGLLPPPHL